MTSLQEEIEIDPYIRLPKVNLQKKNKETTLPWYLVKREVKLYESFLGEQNTEYLKYG